MELDVVFLPLGLGNLLGRTAVVIDVLRATTTIITALQNGCPEVLPVELPEEASELARKFGREGHLVGGERKGLKVEGFDLGNSPGEYTPEALAGRKVILCTTNGTGAIKRVAASQARPLYLAAFLNAPAVAARIVREGNPTTIVCSGREESFSLEDALCAGLIASRVLHHEGWEATDGARAAVALWESFGGGEDLGRVLAATDHGRYLASIGFAEDLALAGRIGTHDLIPVWREGRVLALNDDDDR